ncbi:hypothetical protein OAX78_04090 [Planctomycetota bacterium]|nr:hypothetical protein [Planctomycetota bacterium]
MNPFSRIKRKHLVAGSVLLAVVGLALVAWNGPNANQQSECLFCGQTRYEAWWWGFETRDEATAHEWSQWIQVQHPAHSQHVWAVASRYEGSFGSGVHGCGGVAAIPNLYYVRHAMGPAEAATAVDEYHALLAAKEPVILGADEVARWEAISDLSSHVNAAVEPFRP